MFGCMPSRTQGADKLFSKAFKAALRSLVYFQKERIVFYIIS
jgi:hypothetical protein